MAKFLNKALFPSQKRLLVFLPNTWLESPLYACETAQKCFLCTMINGGRMHYMQLFAFKASSVQRYILLDNLILCCRYSQSQTDFGGFNWKRISQKYHQISSQLPSWVHQQERFADQQQAIYLMMQQVQLHLEEAIEMEISQTQWFCLINACFAKSQSTRHTKTRGKLNSVQEFCADEIVRACASHHVKQNTDISEVARDVIGICAKDLISSEAKTSISK